MAWLSSIGGYLHSDDRHTRPGIRWLLPHAVGRKALEAAPLRQMVPRGNASLIRRGLTLRFALLTIMSVFGLGLLVLVGLNGVKHVGTMRSYKLEREIDQTRQAIRSALIEARTAKRRLDYQALGVGERDAANSPLAIAVNEIGLARDLAEKRGDLLTAERLTGLQMDAAALLSMISVTSGHLDSDKEEIDTRLAELIAALAERRSATTGELHLADVQMAILLLSRDQTLARQESLEVLSDIIARIVKDKSTLSSQMVSTLDTVLNELMAPELAFLSALSNDIKLPRHSYQEFSSFIRDEFSPDLEEFLKVLQQGPTDDIRLAQWIAQLEQADLLIRKIFDNTDQIVLNHIDDQIARARNDVLAATTGGVAVLAAYIFSILMIAKRLVLPMARLQKTLMRLAKGDLSPIEAQNTPFEDVRSVVDALRVFRMDAIRRERLLEERMSLTAELMAANREMRADLEAAAALQLSQLPRPGRIGPFLLSNYFRASKHLGGDSFDYFRREDGSIVLFQLDVAGHGTAASLAAVSAHTALKRALIESRGERGIIDALCEVNANWSDDLPYFTVVAACFDPNASTGTLVQAGHPYPVLLPKKGKMRRLGTGGLPVGVHPEPGYENSTVSMDTGDRLIIFSDGLYEVKNEMGNIFGEDRLFEIISSSRTEDSELLIERIIEALRSWTGATEIDDDISLIIMERS